MAITKRYRLTCVITEGNPYRTAVNDKFIWSRDEFRSDTNPLQNPPDSLEALKVTSTNALLTWNDSTKMGKTFIIKIREKGSNFIGDIYYSDRLGLTIDSESFLVDFSTWGLTSGEWMWSVSSIFDEDKKHFTMWSDESLLIIK